MQLFELVAKNVLPIKFVLCPKLTTHLKHECHITSQSRRNREDKGVDLDSSFKPIQNQEGGGG